MTSTWFSREFFCINKGVHLKAVHEILLKAIHLRNFCFPQGNFQGIPNCHNVYSNFMECLKGNFLVNENTVANGMHA